MLPLLTAPQIREADAYTIANEPISSIDLMERAAKAFVGWFLNHFPDKKKTITVYCGTGNNGGDGLAIARMLDDHQYKKLKVKVARFSDKASDDFNANLKRLRQTGIPITEIRPGDSFTSDESGVIIDALLGTGLNKPLEGDYKKLVSHINSLGKTVVAVDVPTGFFSEGEIPANTLALRTDLVITFQQPKINFLLPESAEWIECWEAVNIGIDEKFVHSLKSPYQAVEEKDIRRLLRPRHKFTNKGTYGHALLVAGQEETMGAALLSAAACSYAGAGLTTACVPKSGLNALNSYMPELMAIVRNGAEIPLIEWGKFSSIGIGPGLGKTEESMALFADILSNCKRPMVIDADALNLLAQYRELWSGIPENSILTPHMKEFDRLFGEHTSWWQRIQTGLQKAKELKLYILLKNDYTIVITPGGAVYFNTTGNAAMATGGMGDVLTGVITSLLAQKYSPEKACIIGAYIHGKAGDELALTNKLNVVMPGQVLVRLPTTMAKLMA
ncbi:NAD(P)H-hydrate dehydratase [Mucilaginibacter xinganensis]|uniref:Bifunctional NAD(P)H-hydrate repair enzyme n=1 Tax=Mucilaginibacter xinganensis TaxID=1234841 RepID=A0A223NSU4_9SPHI|nr:NAD(P)H-hydrate dehydratase [Mucilaginibacter xinganensis]ASU32744.1 bifunctional ADP-dependent NAD(P)H-hydrate dehydratase/NAD(P)H-hydrate epimerase [Mucilaginibacter xinganensis]